MIDNIDKAVQLENAASYMDKHGWCKGKYMNDEGEVCLLGSLIYANEGVILDAERALQGAVDSAGYFSQGVARFNDNVLQSKEEAITFLISVAKGLRELG